MIKHSGGQSTIVAIQEEIIKRCRSAENKFGHGVWEYHIKAVVDNAIRLAEEYGADVEIVTLAALLHDVGSITKAEYVEEHNIHGARIAGELLDELDYPKDKIELIKKCILNHRASKPAAKASREEVCVADADAMAHFDNIPSLFSLVYKEKGLTISDGAEFVKQKLKRSYGKLSEEGKQYYKTKYQDAMSIFKDGK